MWDIMKTLILIATVLFGLAVSLAPAADPVQRQQPAQNIPLPTMVQAVATAYADIITIPEVQRYGTRYLYFGSIQPDRWDNAYRVLTFHCNQLSREPDIVRPRRITPWLAAINLEDYHWNHGVWERLADADFYFHVGIKVKTQKTDDKKAVQTAALAPWLTVTDADRKTLKSLTTATESQIPIVNALWFFWQTAIQFDRDPGYYDFLGIRDGTDFELAIGYDAKALKNFPRRNREAVAESGVAINPRRVDRVGTIGGGYWLTADFKNPRQNKNPLLILNGEIDPDAHEAFGLLPNGLWAFFLADGKGVRQDSAPDFVGYDRTTYNNDGRIHVGLGCVRCHGANAGINPIDGWVKNLFANKLALQAIDYKKLRELQRLYGEGMDDFIEDDRRVYTRALKRCNGWTPEENAKQYGSLWAAVDSPVDAERAARELEVTKGFLLKALDQHVKLAGGIDTVLATYISANPKSVPFASWREFYSQARFILEEVKP